MQSRARGSFKIAHFKSRFFISPDAKDRLLEFLNVLLSAVRAMHAPICTPLRRRSRNQSVHVTGANSACTKTSHRMAGARAFGHV